MYLSRIELDISKKQTQVALSARNKFHGAIENTFFGEDDERLRNLWRIDKVNGKMYLLLLSRLKPDLSNLVKQFGVASSTFETKEYDVLLNRITEQSVWQFRLVANPTKCLKKANGRGKRVAHVTPEHQKEWLVRQAEKHGFQISGESLQIMDSTWMMFNKRGERMVRALAVTYEGLLKVTDVERFRIALIDGIGREKAYGMGLLTIMRTNSWMD